MLPPLDAETLLYFAMGAIGMAALDTLIFAFRDRKRLLHHWRDRAEPVPEPIDDSGYEPNAVTDAERSAILRNTLISAAFAGAAFAGYMQGTQLLVLAILAAAIILTLLRALFEDGAATVEVGEGGREAIGVRERLTRVGAQVVALATLALFALESREMEPIREQWSIADGTLANLLLAGGFAVFGWHLFEMWRSAPEDDAEEGYASPFAIDRDETIVGLVAMGFFLVVVTVGVLVVT